MRWFKHDTDASSDLAIVRLEQIYGNDGYSVFFKCLEIVGQLGASCKLSFKDYPKSLICKKANISEERLSEILLTMAELGLCSHKALKSGIIHFPKLASRADDYTARKRRESEQATNGLDVIRVRDYYFNIKGYQKESLTPSDYGRHGKRAKELIERARGDIEECLEALDWVAGKGYNEWSMETVIKKYPDFLGERKSKNVKELEAIIEEKEYS